MSPVISIIYGFLRRSAIFIAIMPFRVAGFIKTASAFSISSRRALRTALSFLTPLSEDFSFAQKNLCQDIRAELLREHERSQTRPNTFQKSCPNTRVKQMFHSVFPETKSNSHTTGAQQTSKQKNPKTIYCLSCHAKSLTICRRYDPNTQSPRRRERTASQNFSMYRFLSNRSPQTFC